MLYFSVRHANQSNKGRQGRLDIKHDGRARLQARSRSAIIKYDHEVTTKRPTFKHG